MQASRTKRRPVRVELDAEDFAALRVLAARLDVSMAEVVRRLVTNAVRGSSPEADAKVKGD